jgi:hypothetical protein
METVGEYEYSLKDLIGHGAFAVVFKGRHQFVSILIRIIYGNVVVIVVVIVFVLFVNSYLLRYYLVFLLKMMSFFSIY